MMGEPGTRLPPSLAWIPWWLSVIMAIAGYLFLKYLGPQLAISAGLTQLAGFLPQTAPLVAIAFLLVAAKQLYDSPHSENSMEEQDSDVSDKPDDRDETT